MLITSLEREHESYYVQIIHIMMTSIRLFHMQPKAVSRRRMDHDAPLQAWLNLPCSIARSESLNLSVDRTIETRSFSLWKDRLPLAPHSLTLFLLLIAHTFS